jgi:hypothetical protein
MIAAEQNFMFFAQYLPGKLNSIANSLSRLQMDKFCKLAPKAEETSCKVPGPEDILWNSNHSPFSKLPLASLSRGFKVFYNRRYFLNFRRFAPISS